MIVSDKEKVIKAFSDAFEGQTYERIFFAPGRVNLIGEHTDYNGGFVFPAALTQGTYIAVRQRNDGLYRLISGNMENHVQFSNQELHYLESHTWGNYIKGVLHAFDEKGYSLNGADLYVWGNIPNGAGLSSSASLEMVAAFMVSELTGADLSRVELAKLSQIVENQFMGVNSGIMDQFAVGLGEKDHALFIDTASLDYEKVPLDLGQYKVVITNTNKRRELADSKYNERRAECEEGLRQLKDLGLQIQSLSECTEADWQVHKVQIKDPTIRNRINHVVTENQRVIDAVNVLKNGELEAFGKLMDQSHESLATDYEVTGIELDHLVNIQRQIPGCIGSRMTGAGFGGCTVSLVSEEKLDVFFEQVLTEYEKAIGWAPTFYVSDAGSGVHELA
ncbi:galactokinase [Alkalicoccobacillus plakortidis]|uniref:Galactokinase n=1 Tax=Alkalicoccobacillus plakortidis TaxID=444060 RepID=A0ABT0XIU0_9BACI|nr:galactokinase [Alkalicoccobacillus plakortidis]MCM2675827.1 galactokinase [Alkalicoccobacillus plakortidis]